MILLLEILRAAPILSGVVDSPSDDETRIPTPLAAPSAMWLIVFETMVILPGVTVAASSGYTARATPWFSLAVCVMLLEVMVTVAPEASTSTPSATPLAVESKVDEVIVKDDDTENSSGAVMTSELPMTVLVIVKDLALMLVDEPPFMAV